MSAATERNARAAAAVDVWRARLTGTPDVLELPTDRRRPPELTPETERSSLRLPAQLRDRLVELATANEATLEDALLAGWSILLQRYATAETLLVGVPRRSGSGTIDERGTSERPSERLCLRVDFSDDPEFGALLRSVVVERDEAEALPHAPMEAVVEALAGPSPDTSRHPLFQATFEFAGGASEAGHRADREPGTPLDLALHVEHGEAETRLHLDWSRALFEADSAERMLDHLTRILAAAADDPRLPVSRIPLLGSAERDRVLHEWNDTSAPYRDSTLMFQPFETNADDAPDRLALLFEDERVSYGELNARANRLAHFLRGEGANPGSLVAVCLERSVELVVALLAVQKAGAAYVPLDPDHPPDRLRFMVEDAQAPLVVTETALAERLPAECRCITVDGEQDRAAIAAQPEANPAPVVSADALAYIIYTSGSTGLPKGVVVRHQPALNLIDWVNESFEVGPADRLLFVTSPTFDLSVYDVFGMLAAGGSIRIASPRELADPDALVARLCEGGITFWDSAPGGAGSARSVSAGTRAGKRSATRLPERRLDSGPTAGPVACCVSKGPDRLARRRDRGHGVVERLPNRRRRPHVEEHPLRPTDPERPATTCWIATSNPRRSACQVNSSSADPAWRAAITSDRN